MEKSMITIRATVQASTEKAWECYTIPEHITKWNFASDDWHCPAAFNELKVGGTYRVRMEAKDGSFGFDLEATYDSLEPGKSFAYTMADGRPVQLTMQALGNTTEVSIMFEAENQNPIELQRDGWQAILNNYKKYTESV
jgi:uncharacterized protein YndB with AHSA1/START domain